MTSPPTTWSARFLEAFVPAFLATGVALGTIYVLIMKALRADRQRVEEWLDNRRKRLQSGHVPVIEFAQPVMLGVLYAIYGRNALRRFVTSLLIGTVFTSTIFGVVFWRYKHLPASARVAKTQIEQEVDPVLYKYVHDPALRHEYEKSSEYWPKDFGAFVYHGQPYDDLRGRTHDFPNRLAAKMYSSPSRAELTLVFFMEGSYLEPGFAGKMSFSLFLFNVVLDFTSVTVVILALQRLGRDTSLLTAILSFTLAICGTLIFAAVAFISYRVFFSGDTKVFAEVLVGASVVLLFGWIGALPLYVFSTLTKLGERAFALAWALAAFAFPVWVLHEGVNWRATSLGFVNWRDLFSVPYVLAGTTFMPATLSVAAFALVLLAKLTAEPARLVPEAYMTFVKEELGGTQAAGIITVLSAVVAVVVGLMWPS